MKKLLVLMLVLGLASVASATVIDVVPVDVGTSGGRLGGRDDMLQAGDVIGLKIVLNANPYAGYPSYDGYWTDGIDVGLAVAGPGSLGVVGLFDKLGNRIGDDLKHAAFDVWAQSDPLIADNAIGSMSGGVLTGGLAGGQDLIWNLLLECTGGGDVAVDLVLNGGRYADYQSGAQPGMPYGDVVPLTEGDLGDLVIHQEGVPEPMTIALLGLGGLLLRRRR